MHLFVIQAKSCLKLRHSPRKVATTAPLSPLISANTPLSARPLFCSIYLMHRILRLTHALFILHCAVIALCFALLKGEPKSSLRLTSRSDGILIYGKNFAGLMTIRHFKNWSETERYLNEQKITIPVISYAERGLSHEVTVRLKKESVANPFTVGLQPINKMEPDADTSKPAILWKGANSPAVLYTPDETTAVMLARYVRYQGLSPGPLGFSLALEVSKPGVLQ